MRKLSMIISIILISIILSIPTYAGTKKSEEDQISIRINEYEDSMGDNKTYFRIDVGDRCLYCLVIYICRIPVLFIECIDSFFKLFPFSQKFF